MSVQNITIEFKQKNAPELIKSVKDLDKATKKLANTHIKAGQEAKNYDNHGQRITAGQKAQGKGIDGLLGKFAVLRNRLLLAAFAYKGVIQPIARVTMAAVKQSAEFEALRTRLTQLFGSVELGSQAFAEFNQIAATTPYTLQDVVSAGAQLEAFGADSRALLSNITDLAAFMGTNATEAANAFGRAFAAGAGAADILRERGIINLVKEFKGIEDISKLTLPEFREALIESMQKPSVGIAGATARLAQTFVGAYSNMQDATARLSSAFGDLLRPTITTQIRDITELAEGWAGWFLEIKESELETLVRQMTQLGASVEDLKGFRMALLDEQAIREIQNFGDEFERIQDRVSSKQGWQGLFDAFSIVGTHIKNLFSSEQTEIPITNSKLYYETLFNETGEFGEKLRKQYEDIGQDVNSIVAHDLAEQLTWWSSWFGPAESIVRAGYDQLKPDENGFFKEALLSDEETIEEYTELSVRMGADISALRLKTLDLMKSKENDTDAGRAQIDANMEVWKTLLKLKAQVDAYTKALVDNKKSQEDLANFLGKDLSKVFVFSEEQVKLLENAYGRTKMAKEEIINTTLDLIKNFRTQILANEKLAMSEEKLDAITENLQKRLEDLNKVITDPGDKLDPKKLEDWIKIKQGQLKDYEREQGFIQYLVDKYPEVADGLGLMTDAMIEQEQARKDALDAEKRHIDNIQRMLEATGPGQLLVLKGKRQELILEKELIEAGGRRFESAQQRQDYLVLLEIKIGDIEKAFFKLGEELNKDEGIEKANELFARTDAGARANIQTTIDWIKANKEKFKDTKEYNVALQHQIELQAKLNETTVTLTDEQREIQGLVSKLKSTQIEHNEALVEKLKHDKTLIENDEKRLQVIKMLKNEIEDLKKVEEEESLVPDIPILSFKKDQPLSRAFGSELSSLRKERETLVDLVNQINEDLAGMGEGADLKLQTDLNNAKAIIEGQLGEIDEVIGEKTLLDRIVGTREDAEERSQFILNTFQEMYSTISGYVDDMVANDIQSLKAKDSYINASSDQREIMEEEVYQKHADKQIALFYAEKVLRLGQIAMDTARAVTEAIVLFPPFGSPMKEFAIAMGGIQAGMVLAQQPPSYGEGGFVGGQPHSQGGTLIEAELGEYIINKEAVNRFGTTFFDNLNNKPEKAYDLINFPFFSMGRHVFAEKFRKGGLVSGNREDSNTGNKSINVTINNPILSRDYVEDELPRLISEAVRRGADFGI